MSAKIRLRRKDPRFSGKSWSFLGESNPSELAYTAHKMATANQGLCWKMAHLFKLLSVCVEVLLELVNALHFPFAWFSSDEQFD